MSAFAREFRICLFSVYSRQSHFSLNRYLSTIVSRNRKEPALENAAHNVSEFLTEKYHFSPQTASKISSLSTCLKNPQNSDYVLSFLKESGFSDTQLDIFVRRKPQLICASLVKTIKPKIKIFEDLGFSAVEIAEILTKNPFILKRSAMNFIIPSLTVLKGLLGSNSQVTKLLTKFSWHKIVDLKKTLLPNIEFLKSCGVSVAQINSLVYTCANFFMLSPENIRRCVHKADEMGVERTSMLFIYAVRVISSMSDATWEMKLKTFRDLGFSEDDILRAFREAPCVLSVSERKIKMIKEVLLETGKYDMSCIIKFPMSLVYSVEKRYKPRIQILKDLERRGLIDKWPSLPTLSVMTDTCFRKRFVAPNDNEGCKDSAERVI